MIGIETADGIGAPTEDVRARPAIDRMVGRLMESPTPGQTVESTREFVVGLARRNDWQRPLHELGMQSRLTKSRARLLVVQAVELACLRHPRIQRAIGRVQWMVHAEHPGLSQRDGYTYAARRFLDVWMTTPPMVEICERLYVQLVQARVTHADAPGTLAELLRGTPLDETIDQAQSAPTPTLHVDMPVALELHPAQDTPVP